MPIPYKINAFFKKFHLDYELKTMIDWEEMNKIYDHFVGIRQGLNTQADFIANLLRSNNIVHTVRSRVKDPEHLIDKLIRKTSERKEKKGQNFCFTVDNYQDEITDLIGVRAIHIFKNDWECIHNLIHDTWDVIETKANIRAGDNTESFDRLGIEVDHRETGYRSVHYLIKFAPTNKSIVAEIQVRTIFEEGYGEIDHLLRYPHGKVPDILASNLLLFNRIVGSADEMASFINFLKENLKQIEIDHQESLDKKNSEIELLKEKIIKMEIKEQDRVSLLSSVSILKENKSPYWGEIKNVKFKAGNLIFSESSDDDNELKE
jgi:ppGpp synthetase/RelA/SpoT-type nucleotidyltranferase